MELEEDNPVPEAVAQLEEVPQQHLYYRVGLRWRSRAAARGEVCSLAGA